jgi:electron transport complex protein RnfD
MDNTNITISATPHIRSGESIQSIMRDVIIALLPATVMGIVYFRLQALLLIVISIASAVIAEALYQKGTKQKVTISDLSAVVTGLLLAMNLPASAPWWVPIVGSVFAIVIAKQLFGGLGQNFVNPALAGRAFLLASYPTIMTSWVTPGADAVSTATPLALLKAGTFEELPSLADAFLGNIGGCIGETCALALIIGGIYLIWRGVISWRIPVVYIVTVFVLTAIIGRNGVRMPIYELCTGGLMLGAFFMATDYATSPVTPKGQIIMAVGCGLLTTLIRIFGGYPEGVSYSILIMNLCVPLIERYTKPTIFGALPKEAKKA